MNWKKLHEELWNGEKSICFFVHSGKCFWVVDEKFNFSLDAEKEYRAYLEKGYITNEQYSEACVNFRGGILKLTADNFLSYLMGKDRQVLSLEDIGNLFLQSGLSKDLHRRVEGYLLSGVELSQKDFSSVNSVAVALPSFYVNFDREIFFHMDYGRVHEDLAHSGWSAKYIDFCYLIPDGERYWMVDGSDYWKFRFMQ